MKIENRELLTKGLDILGISYEKDAIDIVEKYISLYCDWNKNINLSSIKEERDIIIRHILDSVSIIPFLDNIWDKSCVDLGSGGGLPGVPLKIFNPRMRIDFSEVSKKKTSF